MHTIANAKPAALRYLALNGPLPGTRVMGVFMVFSYVRTGAVAVSRGAGSLSTTGRSLESTLLRHVVVMVAAENQIGIALLRIRHAVVKRLEG